MQSDVTKIMGMALDAMNVDHPAQAASFILNGSIGSSDGDAGKYASMHSNMVYVSLPDGYNVIGNVPLGRNGHVLFLTNGETGQIGVMDGGSYQVIASSSDFPFSVDHPITGLYRLREGCQRVIYFGDNHSFDYFYNIDRPEQFLTNGQVDIKKLELQQSYVAPCVTCDFRKQGSLQNGQYRFVAEMLDADFNTVGYSHASSPVFIIDGGSIDVTVNDIPDQVSFVRLYVIQYKGESGVQEVWLVSPNIRPSNNNDVSYLFEGVNEGNVLADVERFLIHPVIYSSSKVRLIVDDRLVRKNVTEKYVDYSMFQKAASKIRTYYKVVEKEKDSVATSLMGDEVYDIGIVFQRADGATTPVFHIPGARKDYVNCVQIQGADSYVLTEWNEDMKPFVESQQDLDAMGGIERWKVYNTAVKLADGKGRPGYYEATTLYDDIFPCVDDYWGVDACGFPLEGSPIRHHRMPTRITESIYRDDKIRSIGLEFDNIEYPGDDIVGHYFVIRKRTEKTVLDKGFVVPLINGDEGNVFCYMQHGKSNDHVALFTPYTLQGKSLEGEYLHFEAKREKTEQKKQQEIFNSTTGNKDFYIAARAMFMDGEDDAQIVHASIEEDIMMQPGLARRSLAGTPISNISFSNFVNGNKIDRSVSGFHYVGVKVVRSNMYADLFSGEYIRLHSCMKTISDDQTCSDGDSFISKFFVPNVVIRKIRDSVWSDILIGFTIVIGIVATIATAGAAGAVSAAVIGALVASSIAANIYWIRAAMTLIADGDFDNYLEQDSGDFSSTPGQLGTAYTFFGCEIVEDLYVESDSNYYHSRKDMPEGIPTFFEGNYDSEQEVIDFFYPRIAYYDIEEEKHFVQPILAPEVYAYNKDMMFRSQSMMIYVPISPTTDFCSKCPNEYPNTIIWSNRSFSESVSDGMRIFLSENYINLGDHTGPITAGWTDGSKLFTRTKESMFVLAPNPQVLATNAEEVYLGTGSFLGVPSDQLNPANYGYAGGQGRYDHVSTEHGWFTVDTEAGRIFYIAGGIKEVTDDASFISMWMRRNLPINFLAQFKSLYGKDYNVSDSTINEQGVGVICWYDPLSKRFFVHKRDYRIIDTSSYNESTGKFAHKFTDKERFQDLSFTASFEASSLRLVSFHSFKPAWAFADERTMFMTDNSGSVWATDELSCLSYFGRSYPFIVETTINGVHRNLHVVDFDAQLRAYDDGVKAWIEKYECPFNRAWIYTDSKSSGWCNIIFQDKALQPYGNIGWQPYTLTANKSSNRYRIAGAKDVLGSSAPFSSAWQEVQSYFDSLYAGYMDKEPIGVPVSPSQWETNPINGSFHRIRLSYEGNDKVSINVFNTLVKDTQV
jgi:hypothetical protein